MNDEQFKELIKLLKSMDTKLDILVKILKSSMPKPSIGDEENRILKLCNKKYTINDMVKKTGKTRTNVESVLTNLKKKGLVKSTKIKNKLVYMRF